ncbi:MAG: glycoside hydrolase family 31 protein [Anaerolineae bacterium]
MPLKQMLAIVRSFSLATILSTLFYPVLQRLYEAQEVPASQPRPKAVAREDRPLGRLLSYHVEGQAAHLACDGGTLLLEILAEDLIRFRLLPPAPDRQWPAPPFSYALDPDANWTPVGFEVEEDQGAVTIRTPKLTCRVSRSPFRLSLLDAAGQILSEAGDGLGFRGRGAFCTRGLCEAEAIYGLGEKAFGLNLRGQSLALWNTDPTCYQPGDDPIHLSVPMLIGLRAGRAYGLFFDNPGYARVDLGQARKDRLRYEIDTGALCAYFFAGPDMHSVLQRYTQLTGRMPLPPRWMLGYHQSRWSYYPEEEVRNVAAEFRARRIPCDVLHLDIHYMDGYRIFTWDRERFPDPPRLLADLREQGFRTICIIDPGVKTETGYQVHDEGLAQDLFCRLPDGKPVQGPVWPGMCHFPDFTDPKVRAWWGGLYHSLLEDGVAGFWNDMNEPAIFNGEMPHNVQHHYEGQGASHGEVHNIYGLQMARASAEGVRRLCPGSRVPMISRAGYAGLQRHALVWTGDNYSTWDHLRLGVSVCLNLGLSGIAFCGPDVGGFAGDCTGELLARWTQVGALTPFFRNHSAHGTAHQEPWTFGEPYESICRRWIEFRYELLPYLYTAAWQATQTGLPMMRPLALAFPDDLRTYSLDDQFLVGDALLAAPVGHAGQTRRRVYLPGGPWYDFWSGDRLHGEVDAEAPLERMPLYVRPGSVLPMGPVIQHTGQWPPKALRLHVYPGDGESWLYEDDGLSLDYQQGDFQLTRFLCQSEAGTDLAVRREVTGPFDPGYNRFEVYVHGLGTAPRAVYVDGKQAKATFEPQSKAARLDLGGWTDLVIQQ